MYTNYSLEILHLLNNVQKTHFKRKMLFNSNLLFEEQTPLLKDQLDYTTDVLPMTWIPSLFRQTYRAEKICGLGHLFPGLMYHTLYISSVLLFPKLLTTLKPSLS